jgi:hypothetical protein
MKAYVVWRLSKREVDTWFHIFAYHQCYVGLADCCVLVIVGGTLTVAGLTVFVRSVWLAQYNHTVGKVRTNSFATLPIHNLGTRRGRRSIICANCFTLGKTPSTHCTRGWVGLGTSLKKIQKISPPPHQRSNTRPSSQQWYTNHITRLPFFYVYSVYNPDFCKQFNRGWQMTFAYDLHFTCSKSNCKDCTFLDSPMAAAQTTRLVVPSNTWNWLLWPA